MLSAALVRQLRLHLSFLFTFTTGFVPFALSQALFLIPAAMIQLNPRYTSLGLAFGIFFFLVGQPSNPMDFDPSAFFNNASAILTGAFFASRGIPPVHAAPIHGEPALRGSADRAMD